MNEPEWFNDAPQAVCVMPAQTRHLDSLVFCHMVALPDDVITSLGRAFLLVHYHFYIQDPEGICLVTLNEKADRVTGFVFGGRPGLRKRFILRHFLRFVGTVVWKALVDKRIRGRVFHREPLGVPEEPVGACAKLLFIGTHPEYRRRGIAKALLEAFRCECAKRGCQTMRLMTANQNSAAIALYKEDGWEIVHRSATDTYFRRIVQE